MSGTMYRRPGPTFADLLMGMQTGMGPNPVEAPTTPTPLGGGLNAAIQEQMNIATQPGPFVAEPVGKPSPLWAKILAGIADAGSTYAGGLNSYVRPTAALPGLLSMDAENVAAERRNKEREDRSKHEAKVRAAQLKLQRLLGQEQKQEASAEKQAERTQALTDKQTLTTQQQDFEQRMLQQRQDFEAKQADLNRKAEASLANLRRQIDAGSTYGKEQFKSLKEAYGIVNEIAETVPVAVAKGFGPDKIRQQYRRQIMALGLGKEAADAADAYFQSEVEPQLFELEYEPQGPSPAAGNEAENKRIRGMIREGFNRRAP